MAFATPEATLPVLASGEDDCGISSVQLFRSLNDSRALPMDFDVPRPSPTRFDGQQTLPLSAYGLQPGDVIKLFARIEDNDPAGAKGAESSLVTVQIISQQDFERMQRMREGLEALTSKYRQADRRLESLAADNEELRKELEASQDEELTDANRESLRQASPSGSARRPKKFASRPNTCCRSTSTQRWSSRLDRTGRFARAGGRGAGGGRICKRSVARRRSSSSTSSKKNWPATRQQFDKEATEPLEHLEKIFPLIEDQARFTSSLSATARSGRAACVAQRSRRQQLAPGQGAHAHARRRAEPAARGYERAARRHRNPRRAIARRRKARRPAHRPPSSLPTRCAPAEPARP